MADIIYRLDIDVLESHDVMARLVEAMGRLPGFEPLEYDMNRRGQWRRWDTERAIVDALTQRTQIFEIRGPDDVSAAVATGKHGERPQAIVRLAEETDPEDVVDAWAETDAALPLSRVLLTTASLRRAFASVGVDADDGVDALEPAVCIGWPGTLPAEVARRCDGLGEGPVARQTRGPLDILWLCPEGDIDGEAHRSQLKALFGG
jgi:hypothetical protein